MNKLKFGIMQILIIQTLLGRTGSRLHTNDFLVNGTGTIYLEILSGNIINITRHFLPLLPINNSILIIAL